MFKKVLHVLMVLSSGVFAHVKPFPHQHIGHIHPEDVLVGLLAVVVLGAGAFAIYRLAFKRA